MPYIGALRKSEDNLAEYQELMPMVEEMLCRGSRQQRKEFAEHLAERADAFRVYAYSAAGGDADGLPHPDPKLWKELEASEVFISGLTYTLLLWNQAILYQYWADVLRRNPAPILERFGFE